MNEGPTPADALKAGTALFAGFTWSDIAAILACIYSTILIGEWAWKRIFRGFAQRRGWVK
jgi:hypothetical protein